MPKFKSYCVYLLDSICARIPRGQEKFVCIVDLKGWGYSNCDIRAYIAAIEIMQNYYPERLGKALMIHVPYMFMKAWKMIYPFIDNVTRDKFVFVDDKSLPRGAAPRRSTIARSRIRWAGNWHRFPSRTTRELTLISSEAQLARSYTIIKHKIIHTRILYMDRWDEQKICVIVKNAALISQLVSLFVALPSSFISVTKASDQ
ncbi:hypothetical protein OsJ_04619 [Oryza sativa Japonica Group]|uniref:CRAL-TRIO domain-containing protein n=1 Tax=Oryza sativa subsp. japonica TaxID=39947 RepID=B9EVZ8_ORYSJ|nr:hypothetical protein OsJ_04619 [Oryza sativa Japonica Group]